MKFAKWVFAIAAVHGFLLITPLYFAEYEIGRHDPPAVTHPEYFYGFIGVTLAWQVVFLMIAREPVRHRPIMLAAIVEKALYGFGTLALVAAARVNPMLRIFAMIDLMLGIAFLSAFYLTRFERHSS
jgi:hypothetical protein